MVTAAVKVGLCQIRERKGPKKMNGSKRKVWDEGLGGTDMSDVMRLFAAVTEPSCNFNRTCLRMSKGICLPAQLACTYRSTLEVTQSTITAGH